MNIISKSKKKKILFIAMPGSIHSVRWISQIVGHEWDIYLFPSVDAVFHQDFHDITIYTFTKRLPDKIGKNVKVKSFLPINKLGRTIRRLIGHFFPKFIDSSWLLAQVIKQIKPDIVHSLEIQHSGYLTLDAKKRFSDKFLPWIATNWGSDIYLFGRVPEHVERIKDVLAQCDYYDCECQRDVILARSFGYTGKVLPVLPNTGGLDIQKIEMLRQPGLTSSRRFIAVKGYQGWAGRSFVALRAIELCADILKDYIICIYLASPDVCIAKELLCHATGLTIEIIPSVSHDEMLKLHGKSRISIGLSIGDSISTSFIKAIAMGSFPIQSHTGCASEWIEDGETGILVHPDDPQMVADAIRCAVTNDSLVDTAAEINMKVVKERLDSNMIKTQVIQMYSNLFAEIKNNV